MKPGQAVKDMNSWVKEQTKGLIPQVLSPNHTFRKDMTMLLANALYFKGTWAKTFDPSMTKPEKFHLLNGETIQVSFMQKSKFTESRYCGGDDRRYEYGSYKNCKVLKLPYLDGKYDKRAFSMYVFLPNKKYGLPELMKSIKLYNDMFDKGQIKLAEVELDRILIPKFKFESTIELSNIMKTLGLTLPFEFPGELTGILDSTIDGRLLYVSEILQKCRIETNEKGTEAACVSAMSGGYGSRPPRVTPPVEFVADHPFMFRLFGCYTFHGYGS